MAFRFECSLRPSVHCGRGNGKPTRKRCGYCGGSWNVWEGTWGVFEWTGDGNYLRSLAWAERQSEAAAQREVDRLNAAAHIRAQTREGFVVRFIHDNLTRR